MKPLQPHERIILPLDVSDIMKAENLVDILSSHIGVFKIGFESIYSNMAGLLLSRSNEAINLLYRIRALANKITSEKAFLDVKLADIPNTVGNAVKALSQLGAKMINIYASAGEDVIRAAVANKGNSQIFGVTVLTSMNGDECYSIFGGDIEEKVVQFTEMLVDNGADGVICAPKEGLELRGYPGFDKLVIACPNIRPEWAATKEERERVKDDQNIKRQMTPAEAVKAGIDMLVIGRPITNPPSEVGGPVQAAKRIAEEISQAEREV